MGLFWLFHKIFGVDYGSGFYSGVEIFKPSLAYGATVFQEFWLDVIRTLCITTFDLVNRQKELFDEIKKGGADKETIYIWGSPKPTALLLH